WFREAGFDEGQVVGFTFDGDAVEAFDDAGFGCGAAAGEGVEDGAAGGCDEPHEPPHEVEGFDGGVCYAVHAGPFLGGRFGFVAERWEEPAGTSAASHAVVHR